MTNLILPPHVEPTAPVGGLSYPSLLRVEGYGATRNLHRLGAERLAIANAWLARAGGLNRHGEPNYRVVWGWERPLVYGPGGGADLEFFHLERWMPFEHLVTEEEWERNELAIVRGLPTYKVQPYPRHGDYLNIRTCQWGVKNTEGRRVAKFRWPDSLVGGVTWYEGAFIWDQVRLARTPEQIAKEVSDDQLLMRQREREDVQRIEDEFMIRELVEEQTETLFRNPTLRKDPNFMLSPAVGRKRTRHRMPVMVN